MKKIYSFSGVMAILPVIIIFCCGFGINSDKKIPASKTIVAGKIINLQVYPECKDVKIVVGDYRGDEIIYSDTIKKDGTFRIEFDSYILQDVKFNPIAGSFLAAPGDSIFIDIDFKNIGKVQFSGLTAKLNNDYHSYINSNYSLSDYPRYDPNIGEDRYISECDSIRVEMIRKRDAYIVHFKPEKRLIDWIDKYINAEYYSAILYFAYINRYRLNKEVKWLNSPAKEMLFINNLNLFDEKVMCSKLYMLLNRQLLYIHADYFKDKAPSLQGAADSLIVAVQKISPNSLFTQLLIGQIFFSDMEFGKNTDLFGNNQKVFNEAITYDFIKQPLIKLNKNLHFQRENYLVKHNLIMEAMGNSAGRVLFDSIAGANRGKVIYIDFWATSCAPCIAGMPKFKEMQTLFKDKYVECISLCLGGQTETFNRIMLNAGIEKNKILCSKEENIDLSRAFKISAIPFYAIIDKEGRIFECGNHLGPMEKETVDRIKNLLK